MIGDKIEGLRYFPNREGLRDDCGSGLLVPDGQQNLLGSFAGGQTAKRPEGRLWHSELISTRGCLSSELCNKKAESLGRLLMLPLLI